MMNLDASNSLCVVGLDGMPHTLLLQLLDRGIMPNLRTIVDDLGSEPQKMRVTLPEISSVSWTSYATGVNPGVHGIFGFVDLKPESYQLFFPDFTDCKARTIWQRLAVHGGKSVVINQPFTYPAPSTEGHLVSGFVSPILERSVFPRNMLPALKRMNYQVDIDTELCRYDDDLFWEQLFSTLKNRIDLSYLLWNEDWHYFQVVITGSDRLFHYHWNACVDENHKYYSLAMEYFRAIDRFLGQIYDRMRLRVEGNIQDRFYLLSDHGFCALRKEVNINAWLVQQGFLSFKKNEPRSPGDITDDSKAFCLDPGRIYIHRKGRFPRGSVDADEVESVAVTIADSLAKLQYQQKPVFRRILHQNEVYAGPLAMWGPDLVGLANYGFDLKGNLDKNSAFSNTDLEGMHTWDDAFLLTGRSLQTPCMIWDLADRMLQTLTSEQSNDQKI